MIASKNILDEGVLRLNQVFTLKAFTVCYNFIMW